MLVHFQALGCRLNEAELESWASDFIERGYRVTTDPDEADVVVFNSCAVTGAAERKSRRQIRRLRRTNPRASLVVTGCHASLDPGAVRDGLGVDLVVDNRDKDDLVARTIELPALATRAASMSPRAALDDPHALLLRGRHRGFVKIQDGCRYRCTYCIVTVARGDERSRSESEIIDEINRLHAGGIDEVALTGVHVGGYGSDTGSSLYALLGEILARTAIPRIRLASVEPWDIPDRLIDLFADERLMPHMHLPVQSGCDTVLRRMARRCKTAEYERLVERLRGAVDGFNVTTDLIVGFPGETDAEWQTTLRFVERIGFGDMHIFSFSPRAGTKAARLPGTVDGATAKARSREMHALARDLRRRELQRHVGRRVSVLWEQTIDGAQGVWAGYTPHYHRIHALDPALSAAQISAVEVGAVSPDGAVLLGRAGRPAQRVEFDPGSKQARG